MHRSPPHRQPLPGPDWLAIVRRLEAARSRAFVTGDASVLRSVYMTGCPALTADIVTLHQLAMQRLRVVGFAMTASRVDVVGVLPTRATLRVTDAVSAYSLRGEGTARRINATSPRTFTMQLAEAGGVWRIVEIHR